MAKTDQVTVTARYECIKEVDCACCGTTYRFPYKSSVSGSGLNRTLARQALAKKAPAELEGEPGSERCPTCGVLPDCMDLDSRALGHGCLMWFILIVFGIALLLGYLLNEKVIAFVSLSSLIWVTAVCLLLAVLANLKLVRKNTNENLQEKRKAAELRVEEELVTVVSAGTSGALPNSVPRPLRAVQMLAIVLSIIGIGLLPAAEIVGLVSGWHSNRSAFPPVAGPGEDVVLYWPETLVCLKGFWKGTTSVQFTDEQQTLPLSPVAAACSTEDWGQFVGGRGTRNQETTIWTRITLPDDPGLSGKSIRLPAKISVTYPHSTGIIGFENREAEFANEFQFRLSSPKAAQTYFALWWGGLVLGGGLIALSAFLLRRHAMGLLSTSVYPITLNLRPVEDDS